MNVRYYCVNQRGFANTWVYIRVKPEEAAAVERHFDGWVDRMFNAGDTDAYCGWADDNTALSEAASTPGVALTWPEYLRELG